MLIWRVKTAEEFNKALAESLRTPGPTLIDDDLENIQAEI